MKKTLVFALAAVATGLSVFSNPEAASAQAQLDVNLSIPLGEPVIYRRSYPSYRPYYRYGRVYRYDRDDYRDYRRNRRYYKHHGRDDGYRHDNGYHRGWRDR